MTACQVVFELENFVGDIRFRLFPQPVKPGSRAETLAGSTLSAYYSHYRAEGSPHPEVIKLEDPIQVRRIDALTEAAGVPHERGQTEVIIPEKLRNYSKWVMSQEYQDRLNPASLLQILENGGTLGKMEKSALKTWPCK